MTITQENPLVLASASPRRKELLRQIGLPFRVFPSNVDEEVVKRRPFEVAIELAEKKARGVLPDCGKSWILGADTLIVLGEIVLGKPVDEQEARYMLRLLSGKEHSVITGFAVIDPGGEIAHSECVITSVRIKTLSEGEIGAYIDSGEPFGKAGSYAIQGIGAFLVEGIKGSYSNVVGLPLCALISALLKLTALGEFPIFTGTDAN